MLGTGKGHGMSKGPNLVKWRPFKNRALLFGVVSNGMLATQKQWETIHYIIL
jgi:hypothetical protein